MEGGYVCLGFQSINVIMNDLNQLNKFWMSYSNINQKKNVVLLWQSIMTYFHLECQNLIKKLKNVLFLAHVSYTSFQTFGM